MYFQAAGEPRTSKLSSYKNRPPVYASTLPRCNSRLGPSFPPVRIRTSHLENELALENRRTKYLPLAREWKNKNNKKSKNQNENIKKNKKQKARAILINNWNKSAKNGTPPPSERRAGSADLVQSHFESLLRTERDRVMRPSQAAA